MLRVIDCMSRRIIWAPPEVQYVTLSYVWGQPNIGIAENRAMENESCHNAFLPPQLPIVVEDAIKVTKALGFSYLWVDKYCIDQKSSKKHMELRHMDLIYNRSDVTIIQATGEDENTGLPGVGDNFRTKQPVLTFGDVKIISTMAHSHNKIKKSKWFTRGWTLQESILSRRRLVFTEDQVYFECNAMNCSEALQIPLDVVHTRRKDSFRSFMRAGLFSGRDEGLDDTIFGQPFGSFDDRTKPWSFHFRKYLVLATNYTSRNLSFDSDSLIAFLGITSNFNASKFPIFHVEGIPFTSPILHPHDKKYLDSIVAGLCWRHINSCWTGRPPVRRREQFPSWTWAGWAGAASWTDLFTSGTMDVQSLVENFRCEIADNVVVDLHHYHLRCIADPQVKAVALHMSAWLVPPNIICLLGSNANPVWKIGIFELEVHISLFHGEPAAFLTALRAGQVKCYFVGKGLYNSYFLFIESRGASRIRIGTAEAIYFHDTKYHRFAEEIHFDDMKQEIRLT